MYAYRRDHRQPQCEFFFYYWFNVRYIYIHYGCRGDLMKVPAHAFFYFSCELRFNVRYICISTISILALAVVLISILFETHFYLLLPRSHELQSYIHSGVGPAYCHAIYFHYIYACVLFDASSIICISQLVHIVHPWTCIHCGACPPSLCWLCGHSPHPSGCFYLCSIFVVLTCFGWLIKLLA